MLEGERVEPQGFDDEASDEEEGEDRKDGSLAEHVAALIDDGRSYAEAEIAFQKTRIAFVAEQGRKAAFHALLAFSLLLLALVALVVGAVIALSPLLTPIGATLLVTAVLVLAGILFARKARRRIAALSQAFDGERE